jgi:hypothetical protein
MAEIRIVMTSARTSEQTTGADGGADRDHHAEKRHAARRQRRPALAVARPRPGEGRGDEGRGGIDHQHVGHRGLAQRIDEADGGGRRAAGRDEARHADTAKRRQGACALSPDDVARDEQAAKEAAPEQHGPDVGIDQAGEEAGRAEGAGREHHQGDTQPALAAVVRHGDRGH